MKILWYGVLLPVNLVYFTASVIFHWAIEIFNMPFDLWKELE